MSNPILLLDNITKVYANGFVANKDVTLSVNEGECHALLGENGAGKSTLMKVLFGIETPEAGRVVLRGSEAAIDSPLTAIRLGIGMVHQHFMLVPSLTVAENMILGMEPKKHGFLDMAQAVRMTREVSEKYQLAVDPLARVEDLSVGVKQKIEILKALLRGAKILILDEPTAVLTPQETQELFVQLRRLCGMGHTIIFISHKLQEVMSICDRFTILRLGRSVGKGNIADVTQSDLSRLMVGRDIQMTIDKAPAKPGKPVLRVRDLSWRNRTGKTLLNRVSLSVREGEILGVAGVEGNGQTELSNLVTGLIPPDSGSIRMADREMLGLSVRRIRDLKVSHISEDRMTYGAVSDASIMENIISDRFQAPESNRFLLLDSQRLGAMCDTLIKDYLIKCDDRDQAVGMLSGGNIQKVVAAREFSSQPRLVVANQPTRGIDVGASEFIRKKLVELRDGGAAVLLFSADLNEVLEVSDSIIVMANGEIVAYMPDAKSVTEEALGEYMLGIRKMRPEEVKVAAYD